MPANVIRLFLSSACALAVALSICDGPAAAQARDETDGPVPVAPLTIARAADGRVTVRAVRIQSPIGVDGQLSEDVYRLTPPIDGFIQQEPDEGRASTEATHVWLLFDDTTIYVAARLDDSRASGIVANEMRRDSPNIARNDSFGVIFDTFRDRRNGFFFYTNALGALADQTVTDERESNREWNTVWTCRTSRDERGWTVEMAIPFRSLRYSRPGEQVWGVNFRRVLQGRNELAHLTRVAAAYGRRGIQHLSSAATLIGLVAPPAAVNLEVKPYTTSSLVTDSDAQPAVARRFDPDAGFDLKYGVTQGLTADFSVNTDFAQVEEDEQQVNLTRFGLFFPERREFFLEGQGIFAFGGAGGTPRGGGAGGPPPNTPVLFYSRRIGLQDDHTIPMRYGARLTGKSGRYSIGLLDARTGERNLEVGHAYPTDFLVARVKRDVFRRSSIGAIFTRRGPSEGGASSNYAYGIDGTLVFFQNLTIDAYIAGTDTADRREDATSYRGSLDYAGDRFGIRLERLHVGPGFNPEAGFLRREDINRSYAQVRFSPRPAQPSPVRKFIVEASTDYFESTAGVVETRELQGQFGIDFQNGDEWRLEATSSYEFLDEPFEITDGVFIPVGAYRFSGARSSVRLGPQRRMSGSLAGGYGRFYDGTRAEASFTVRVELSSRLAVEPGLTINWIDLPAAGYRSDLAAARVNYSISPRTLLSAFLQYNSQEAIVTSSARFRWEYRPGSDLFIVYSEGRDTSQPHTRARLSNQSIAVKFTRLFRF